MKAFIHHHDNWPEFTWNSNDFLDLLSEARNLQGRLIGKMETLGFDLRNEALLDTLTLDVLKSSEIAPEGLLSPDVGLRRWLQEKLFIPLIVLNNLPFF